MARSMKEVHTINYYPINEGAARRAKEMNSFSDYKEGSATAEYRAMVDKAAAIAEKQKSRVDPMYHEKIDHLLDTYARKLAENTTCFLRERWKSLHNFHRSPPDVRIERHAIRW